MATHIESNASKLDCWQGSFNFDEDQEWRGSNAAKLGRRLDSGQIEADGIPPLKKETAGKVEFSADWRSESLFSSYQVSRTTGLVWKETGKQAEESINTLQRSVVTPEHYLHYMPNMSMGVTSYPNTDGVPSGPAAFRDACDKAAKSNWSIVPDPRTFFFDPRRLRTISEGIRGRTPTEVRDSTDFTKTSYVDYSTYELVLKRPGISDKPEDGITTITVFDERKGFNPVCRMVLNAEGKVVLRHTWDYTLVKGIYIPSSRSIYTWHPGYEFRRDYTLTDSQVNGEIDPDSFTYKALGMREGERFIDNIEKCEYVHSSGELVRSTGKALMKRETRDLHRGLFEDTLDEAPSSVALRQEQPDASTTSEETPGDSSRDDDTNHFSHDYGSNWNLGYSDDCSLALRNAETETK